MVVIADSIVAGLRHYPTVWRNFILQCKTINLGIGGDGIENVLWCINDTVLPKSIRSVIIHWGTNNIDTSSSDEISVGMVTIARSISHGYPNTEPRTFIGLCREQKLIRAMIIWQTIAKNKKMTFMHQDPDWTLPDNSLNMELY